jgi:Zn-dependent protease/CBS domain-containing protein
VEGAIMSNTLRLGRVFGIELRLDYSWFIIFILITWSLSGHYFPGAHPGWSLTAYWVLGMLTSVLFFTSVVIHELAHSLVSRAHGTPVHENTLFIFGGAAHTSQEPRRPREELLVALAGPGASLALAGLFAALWWLSLRITGPLHALAGWLAWINLMLALFNLIPGFPLDGGRVLRAIVWSVTGNLRRATRIAAGVGRLVAFGFIFYGIWQIFGGNWADGLWIAFIGWFLDNAATQSVQQLALQDLLANHTVREAMLTDCPHVPRRLTLDVLVDQVAQPSGRRCFPVMEEGQFYGLLTLRQMTEVPRDRWPTTRAEDVMIALPELKTARSDDELTAVLDRMTVEDVNQFPVLDNGRFVGMVSRDTLLNFIRARADLAA